MEFCMLEFNENQDKPEEEEEEKRKKFEYLIDYVPHLVVAAVIVIIGLIFVTMTYDPRVAVKVRGFEYQYNVSRVHYEKEPFKKRALNYAIIRYIKDNLDYDFEELISTNRKAFTKSTWSKTFEEWLVYLYPLYTTKAKITAYEELFTSTRKTKRANVRNKPFSADMECSFNIVAEDYNPYNLQCVSGTTILEERQGIELEYTINEPAYISVFMLYLDDLKVYSIATEISEAGRNFFPNNKIDKYKANDLLKDESVIVVVATPKPLKIDDTHIEHGVETIKMYDFYPALHKQKKHSFFIVPVSRALEDSQLDPYLHHSNIRPSY